MKYEDKKKNVEIIGRQISIGSSVTFGQNILIKVKGEFRIGDYSRLGSNTQIFGNNIIFGKHLFNSSGLRIGGGGRQHPGANLQIGDRCTIHNNFINVCEPIMIGDDVGLSPDVSLITHGYWLSVLEGYPARFTGIKIGNGVLVGYRSTILMGVLIADNIVVGANSVVAVSLLKMGIYVGNPAHFVRKIESLPTEDRLKMVNMIIENYIHIASYHDISPRIRIDYPYVEINEFRINVETFKYEGVEDKETDDFRDYIRKWGIRIYTQRPFKSCFTFG